jgi:hypothetical protein
MTMTMTMTITNWEASKSHARSSHFAIRISSPTSSPPTPFLYSLSHPIFRFDPLFHFSLLGHSIISSTSTPPHLHFHVNFSTFLIWVPKKIIFSSFYSLLILKYCFFMRFIHCETVICSSDHAHSIFSSQIPLVIHYFCCCCWFV